MKFLQKLGKSLMLPVATLPICGILMGIGYLLCPGTMQGFAEGYTLSVAEQIGYYLVKAGGAVIDNVVDQRLEVGRIKGDEGRKD